MTLSVVIICWNDRKLILECLESIFRETKATEFEVVVSDNGSTDGSVAAVREAFPGVRVVENGANLGFARGNNAGIAAAAGKYVLILNPDTLIHDRALDKWVAYAKQHPEAGAFGCRVLNRDGSYQHPAQPFPTVWRFLLAAVGLRFLTHLGGPFVSDRYPRWAGRTERSVDWQSGCCVMVRGDLLRRLGGFDERFFYHFEEVDLCLRIRQAGYPILYYPDASITHLGGQSVGRFPIRFMLESYRNRYRYMHKHYGPGAARRCRHVSLIGLRIRRALYGLRARFDRSTPLAARMEMYRAMIRWHNQLDAVRFCEEGAEPDIGFPPFAPPIVRTRTARSSDSGPPSIPGKELSACPPPS